ncbi:PEP-CTERM sorting domain-containing protein [Luteolibacter marinus]|uniref:PEP-CTERM sorting domain-containing protein n=1 Tax=Luteolibacter marinus TaxID=2776705 RepID=UPI001869692C|nr:PEP-CTERM sorting domain-containing protein [Luteolibacter marinus]
MNLRSSLCFPFAFLSVTSASFAAITYDGFDYTAGTTLEAAADWAPLNSGTAPTVVSGNLSVAGLQASSGNMVSFPGGNFQEAIGSLDSFTAGTVYYSFAFQLSSAPTSATYSFALATGNTNYGAPVFLQASGSGFQIGLANRSSGSTVSYDSTEFALNTTIFLVGSYTFNSGTGDDVSQLWINPSNSFFGDETAPSATLTASGGNDLAGITQFLLRGASGSPAGNLDELRVGTSWAAVTVPEPATALLGAFGLIALIRRRR